MDTLWDKIVYDKLEEKKDCKCIDTFKERMSELITQFDYIRNSSDNSDIKRWASITISKLEEAYLFWLKTMKNE